MDRAGSKVILKGLFLYGFALLSLVSSHPALALSPPEPGEIKHLKETGEYAARLAKAEALGNHRIDENLLERALYKARREALLQQGLPGNDTLAAPPPAWKLMPTMGVVKIFALLIDFSDYPAYNTQAGIHSALFGDGSAIPSNAAPYDSLASFYRRSSYDQLDLSQGVTLGWYRPAYTRASMPMTTPAREALIKEAIASFDGSVDFSQFDNDGDGKIEYFVVIWTGPNNGWANFWWGYQTSFMDQTFTVDGKRLGKYSWQWEYRLKEAYLGPFNPKTVDHETGHGLGLPDYYDYNETVGPSGGVGGLDMMDGNWGDHNCFSKWVLGWITPTVVASGSRAITLNPSGTSRDAILIMPGTTSDDPFREFFMAQNRYRAGNDLNATYRGIYTSYPTDGMLIWHVDARLNGSGTNYLYNNSYTAHKLLKLVQADGLDRIENNLVDADAAMYYTAGSVLGPLTVPSSKDYLGVDTRVNVTGITQSWPQMTATFSIDDASTLATLTVAKGGTGAGTVTGNPSEIACGSDCQESYAPGTGVTLAAAAATGSAFAGWSGGGCSGRGDCTLTLSTDTTVTATFGPAVTINATLPHATTGASYSQPLTATGGTPPFSWAIDAGALPIGLGLNGATGLIAGTAVTPGVFSFVARLVDSIGVTTTQNLAITVSDTLCTNDPVRIASATPVLYPDFLTAYPLTVANDTLQLQALDFSGEFLLDRDVAVVLAGGYDCAYSAPSGMTGLKGNVRIRNGTVRLGGVRLR